MAWETAAIAAAANLAPRVVLALGWDGSEVLVSIESQDASEVTGQEPEAEQAPGLAVAVDV